MSEGGASGTASSQDAAWVLSTAEGGGLKAIDEDDDLCEDQDAGEVERLTPPQVLRAVQRTALSIPIQNPALLPLHQLDPDVLDRLAAEVVSHRNNLGAHFYGRRGQSSTAWISSNSRRARIPRFTR
jgi:hypothetical protein